MYELLDCPVQEGGKNRPKNGPKVQNVYWIASLVPVLKVSFPDLCRESLLGHVVHHPARADVVEGLAVEEREEDVGGVATSSGPGQFNRNILA